MAGRTVAITGAGAGIGKAIAESFLAAGETVYIGDISEERLRLAEQSLGHGVRTHVLDVSDYSQMSDFVGVAIAETGRLDVFVNNAGLFDGYAGIHDTSAELWRRIIDVNLTGYFNGCKAASEVMAAAGVGRIINIGSVAGKRGAADGLSYAASKAGIEGMTRRLAIDLGPSGVTANVVAPGVTATDIRANSAEQIGGLVNMDSGVGTSKELMDFLIPVGRPGRADEVASAVFFLASDTAAYITGQTLHVDGGWSAT